MAIHGDEADSHRRRTFSILTVGSLTVPPGQLFDNKFLVFCLDNSVATPDTASTLEKWVAHSLAELQQGSFSQVDPWGAPFPSNYPNRSGDICGGFKCVLAMVKGDEKWHQRTFRTVTSWVSKNPCLHCAASVNSSRLLYTSFGPNAPHRNTLVSTTTFIEQVAQCQTWTAVPGFSIEMVTYDWLHITDLCIIPECSASALKLVCNTCRHHCVYSLC